MKKFVDFIKRYWALLLAGLAFIAGIIFKSSSQRTPPPSIKPPPEDPPEKEEAKDFVGEHKEEKEKIDAKVDDMSRDELVDSINSRYD